MKSLLKSGLDVYMADMDAVSEFFCKKQTPPKKIYDKLKVKYYIFLVISIFLSASLGVSIYYNINGGFALQRLQSYDVMLGQDIVLNIDNYGSYSKSISFSGESVTGLNYKQNVYVTISENLNGSYLRTKCYLSRVEKNQELSISGFTNWLMGDDGYLYYLLPANSGDRIGVINNIYIPEMTLQNEISYNLVLSVECVPTSLSASDYWQIPQTQIV